VNIIECTFTNLDSIAYYRGLQRVACGALCRGPPAVLKKNYKHYPRSSAHSITVSGQIDAPATFPNYVYMYVMYSFVARGHH
jgi:hypothetical protein